MLRHTVVINSLIVRLREIRQYHNRRTDNRLAIDLMIILGQILGHLVNRP